ncbi:hypothetical protein [Streptomyces vinaceus]|uniref:hypothetical protein n=1 Tax=Streptomyces vinaceus TaxID=1960 RepID=UPI00142EAB79|nr:hypothetical protein [Streptomyces vinaceus]
MPWRPPQTAREACSKEWISSPPADNAQSETTWTASCWGSSWDKRERVWGDYRGFVGGYLKDE